MDKVHKNKRQLASGKQEEGGGAQPQEKVRCRMKKTRRYNIEGAILDIPLYYDERAEMYVEVYPDFTNEPVYTPAGYPILFTGEDACPYGEPAGEEPCTDCGSCRFYRQTPGTWIGVCGHGQRRRAEPESPPGLDPPPQKEDAPHTAADGENAARDQKEEMT